MATTRLGMLEVGLLLTCMAALISGYVLGPSQVPRTYLPSPSSLVVPNLPLGLGPSVINGHIRPGYTPSAAHLTLHHYLTPQQQTIAALRFIEMGIRNQIPNRFTTSTLYQREFTPSQYTHTHLARLPASVTMQPQGLQINPFTSVQSHAQHGLFEQCLQDTFIALRTPATFPGTFTVNPTFPAGNVITPVTAQLRSLLPPVTQIFTG